MLPASHSRCTAPVRKLLIFMLKWLKSSTGSLHIRRVQWAQMQQPIFGPWCFGCRIRLWCFWWLLDRQELLGKSLGRERIHQHVSQQEQPVRSCHRSFLPNCLNYCWQFDTDSLIVPFDYRSISLIWSDLRLGTDSNWMFQMETHLPHANVLLPLSCS